MQAWCCCSNRLLTTCMYLVYSLLALQQTVHAEGARDCLHSMQTTSSCICTVCHLFCKQAADTDLLHTCRAS